MKVYIMPRAVSLALAQFEVPTFARPSLAHLRAAYRNITRVNGDATAIFNANDSLRRTARGGMN